MDGDGGTSGAAIVDGELVDASDGKTIVSRNPATGKVFASFADCSETDIDEAVSSARRAFDAGVWSRRSPAERKSVLLRLAEVIEAGGQSLARLDTADAGKPISEMTAADIPGTIQTFRWYAELADKEFGKIAPTDPASLGLIVREPIGVVAAILPWNFPTSTAALKIAPALAAGNSIVVKPPEQASLSTIRLGEMALEAGIPPGVFNVVPGKGEIAGRALGLHHEVDVVSFTGSGMVGRKVLQYSSESNLKRVVLELGGKSPQIVLADAVADLDRVAEQLAVAAFYNSGQNCTCGSRIIVDARISGELTERLANEAKAWRVGDPTDPATRNGPLIEPEALDRVISYVDSAVSDGAQVVAGGQRVLEETGGWYVEPTVLAGVENSMAVAQQEIFGPVVSIINCESEDDAIRLANDSQ